jgi:hypothetical protein
VEETEYSEMYYSRPKQEKVLGKTNLPSFLPLLNNAVKNLKKTVDTNHEKTERPIILHCRQNKSMRSYLYQSEITRLNSI